MPVKKDRDPGSLDGGPIDSDCPDAGEPCVSSGTRAGSGRVLIGLHVLLLVYSFADVLSKLAAGTDFLSLPFIGLYGGVLVLLAVYALGWQQVIARMPLTAAYANRAVTLVWGIVWGVLFFGEAVTWQKLLGAAVIMAGIVLFAREDGAPSKTAAEAARAGSGAIDAPGADRPQGASDGGDRG